jgi:hypothetical protein
MELGIQSDFSLSVIIKHQLIKRELKYLDLVLFLLLNS